MASSNADRAERARQLRREYERGATVNDLSRTHGIPKGTVHSMLKDAGTKMRQRGRPQAEPGMTDAERRQLASRLKSEYESGKSERDLAKAHKLSRPHAEMNRDTPCKNAVLKRDTFPQSSWLSEVPCVL